ncbi:MAG: FKBP-type peptidyl-prolyl cis-trans isomerase [Armatimonadetes bacterium]|nr:FKBP-type peptidyl-prolyl cis-trans isomerase [Armatimonadota bacterium]
MKKRMASAIVLAALGTVLACAASGAETLPPAAPAATAGAATGDTQAAPSSGPAAGAAAPAAAPKVEPGAPALKSDRERASYVIGLNIGDALRRDMPTPDTIDVDALARGVRAALDATERLLTPEEADQVMARFREEIGAKRAAIAKALGEKNQKEGDTFLADHRKKEGVVTLASGLQYRVLQPGTGQQPKPTDMVTVNYRGALIGGKEFDSSYSRGEPVTFPVDGVIAGWSEALPLMKVGAKWELVVPSKLAYGEGGAGPDIGPNATLIFEVELLGIEPASAPEPAGNKPAEAPAPPEPAADKPAAE